MDLESYNKVINGIQNSEDPNTPRKKNKSGFSRAEIAFKKDLLRNKVVWFNDKKKDWKCYVALNHPALSICRVPKQHPFGRVERFGAFMIDFGLSACFAFLANVMVDGMKDCDDPDDPYDWYVDDDPTNDCPGPLEFPDINLLLYGQAYSLGFAIINAISNGCVKTCATCACCQKKSCPKCCRCCAEAIGDCVLLVWLLGVLGLCGLFSSLAWQMDMFTLFMLNFAGGRLWSWIWAFVMMRCCFNKKWKKEKANKGKTLNKFKVTYIDYELYVNKKQIEIPADYQRSRTMSRANTIGSEAGGTIASPQSIQSPNDVQAQTNHIHALQMVTK